MSTFPYPRSSVLGSMTRSKWLRVAVAYSFVCGQFVLAAPQGEQVVHGQASFSRQGDVTQITASHNAVINYTGFDIHSHEAVRFVQPSAVSRVLNRIHSGSPTQIAGSLQANGHVYIVNPAGVIFANGAQIDVAGLYAAAAQMSNVDFLNNVNRFTDVMGSVVNHGTIDAGFVALVGQHVANYGSILADEGLVTMVAGDDVLLGRFDDHLMMKITGAVANLEAPSQGVENSGQITAAKGKVKLSAGDMFSVLLHDTGHIKADQITVEGGQESTVQVAGALDASNAEGVGGSVHVWGDRVAVDHAVIDASGRDGGGQVLIGGDYQGKGDVVNARRTDVGSEAVIHADAWGAGDGGKVIVWAEEFTAFGGSITARGGSRGGDGGLVETSGKLGLGVASGAVVNTSASLGHHGRWLLDPTNARIVATPPPAETSVLPVQFDRPDIDSGGGADDAMDLTIDVAAINSTESGLVDVQATNDITVETDINITTAGVGLNLTAGRSVLVNNNITTNGGDVNMTANGGGITLGADVDARGGNATLTAFDSITGSGVVTGSSLSLNAGRDGTVGTSSASKLNTNGSTLTATGGNGVFINDSGNVTLGHIMAVNGPVDLIVADSLIVDQTIEAGQSVDLQGRFVGFNLSGMVDSTTGGVTVTATTSVMQMDDGSVIDAGDGRIVVDAGSGSITLGRLVTTADDSGGHAVTLTAASSGDIIDGGDTGGADIDAVNGTLDITQANEVGINFQGALETSVMRLVLDVQGLDGTGDSAVAITNYRSANLAASTVDGDFNLTATNGDITGSGPVTVTDDATFMANQVLLDAVAVGGRVNLATTGNASVTSDGNLELAGRVGGSLTAQSTSGVLWVSGVLQVMGPVATLTADQADLSGQLMGSGGTLLFQPVTDSQPIGLGATTGGLDLSAAEVFNINGFSLVTYGRDDGQHNIAVASDASVTFRDPVVIQTMQTTQLDGDVFTEGTSLTIDSAVQVGPTVQVKLDTTSNGDSSFGANVTVTGFIDNVLGEFEQNSPSALVIDAGTQGDVDLQDRVGQAADALQSVFISGRDITLNGVTTLDLQTYTPDRNTILHGATYQSTVGGDVGFLGNAMLAGDVTVTAANGLVFFEGTTTGDGASLTVSAAGPDGRIDLGNVTTSRGQTYTAQQGQGPIVLGQNTGGSYESTGTGDILFDGIVELASDTQVTTTDGAIEFTQSIQGDVVEGPSPSLTMTGGGSDGDVTVGGDITDIQSLEVNAGRHIDVHNITTTHGGITLQSSPVLVTSEDGIFPVGLITINSTLQTTGGDIRLNPDGRSAGQVPSVATIVGNGDTTIQVGGGDFTMGAHEKLTSLGDLTIKAIGHTTTIGDLSAGGHILLDVGTGGLIRFNDRGPAAFLDANGQLPLDRGLDIIAAETITLRAGTIETGDHGPTFGSGLGSNSDNIDIHIVEQPGFEPQVPNETVELSTDLHFGSVVLDLGIPAVPADVLVTVIPADLAEALPALLPQQSELAEVSQQANIQQSDKDVLRTMGIPAEDLPPQDMVDFVLGDSAWLINDIAPPDTKRGEHVVTVNRMHTRAVREALRLYRTLYVGMFVDPQTQTPINKADRIKGVLTRAWVNCQAANDDVSPVGFRRFLLTDPESAEAWAYSVLLRSLFHQLQVMGLTRRELQYTCFVLLEREGIIPEGMDRGAFEQLILDPVPTEVDLAPIHEDGRAWDETAKVSWFVGSGTRP